MPRHDDPGIPADSVLIRAVLDPEWVVTEESGERVSSASFVDGNQEASCFIADEVGGVEGFASDILPELSKELGRRLRITTIRASAARSRGLWIYRKPEEYKGNRAHVVICASDSMSKSQYKKAAGRLAEDAKLR